MSVNTLDMCPRWGNQKVATCSICVPMHLNNSNYRGFEVFMLWEGENRRFLGTGADDIPYNMRREIGILIKISMTVYLLWEVFFK